MVKAPRPGEVKTRLVPPLEPREAAELAACFAPDVVRQVQQVIPQTLIAYAPADGRAVLEAILPGGLLWVEQRGADLGAKLEAVAAHAAALGFAPLVFLATDSPTLPASLIEEAFAALSGEEADLTLGPTPDGGYYLLGLRRPVAGLFQNIAWSTPETYQQTAAKAARAGLALRELPPWYDVDEFADLVRLRAELLHDRAARERAPQTFRWLLAHPSLFGAGARTGA